MSRPPALASSGFPSSTIMPSKGLYTHPQCEQRSKQRGTNQFGSLKINPKGAGYFCIVGPQPRGQLVCCLYNASIFFVSPANTSSYPFTAFRASSGSISMKLEGMPFLDI